MTYEQLKTSSIDSTLLKVVQAQMTKTGANLAVFDDIISLLDNIKTSKNRVSYLDNLQKLADSEYKVLNQFKLYDLLIKLIKELR